MVVPLESDDKLAATALSAEKRARQTSRADYWIRIRRLLWVQFREQLLRPNLESTESRVTQSLPLESVALPTGHPPFAAFPDSRNPLTSRLPSSAQR